MRRLGEILILLCFSGLYYKMLHPIETLPVLGLTSLIFTIGLEMLILTGQKKIWQLLVCAVFLGLMQVWPEFGFFLPVFLYSAFMAAGLWSLLLLLFGFYSAELLGVLLGLMAMYLSYRSNQFREFTRQNLELSDRLKEDMISLERYNARLLENEAKSREIARLEERNRIAGQLHDSLGHTISSSILQVEVLILTEAEEGKKERLELLKETLTNGMTDIRKQLHGMYDNVFSLEQRLEELATKAPNVEVRLENQIRSKLSFDKKRDIFHIIREAFTNMLKHSDAESFFVFLKEQGGNQILMISDDGTKAPNELRFGMGMAGMEEIVQKYEGKMNYYFNKGFHIHIFLPQTRIEKESKESMD